MWRVDKFVIKGPHRLKGTIDAGGSKNAALPIMFATLLAEGRHSVRNVPRLADMEFSQRMLLHFGCPVEQRFHKSFGADWMVDATKIVSSEAPYDYVRKMRASFFCMGPLLARTGRARVSLPGGCAIGARPIDLHLMALEKLGADIVQTNGYAEASCKGRLRGGKVIFPKVSVGATENALMAAVLAQGTSIIENAAREPEIQSLARALRGMGAILSGEGTSTIEIQGVEKLRPMDFAIPPDRIEVATYLIGAQMSGGDVTVRGACADDMEVVLQMLEQTGAKVERGADYVRVIGSEKIRPVDAITAPFPGFPTDVQAQWITLMTQADGDSLVTETIFENRFMHVPELVRMGADLTISGSSVRIKGKRGTLHGAPVMATDLRASASLVLAACVADGESEIKRIYHLDRGYETMEHKLEALGAEVDRHVDS
jgi:UDP-N-acetylglucosamine 1-carboxyvinyltransferase